MNPVVLADAFDATIGVVIALVIIAVFAGIIVLAIRQQKIAKENFRKLAATLGLAVPEQKKSLFSSISLRATGQIRGRAVTVWAYTTGSGKNQVQWCAIAAQARNTGKLTLQVSGENFLTRVGRAFGLDDVNTGDAAFDERFYVKSNDASYVRAAFIPEVRERITAAWQAGARGKITVDGPDVKYVEQGNFSNQKICARFPAMADLTCDVADIVETRG